MLFRLFGRCTDSTTNDFEKKRRAPAKLMPVFFCVVLNDIDHANILAKYNDFIPRV